MTTDIKKLLLNNGILRMDNSRGLRMDNSWGNGYFIYDNLYIVEESSLKIAQALLERTDPQDYPIAILKSEQEYQHNSVQVVYRGAMTLLLEGKEA